MTTIALSSDEGADDESGALDPFKGIAQLLPKLAQPSWVRLIGNQLELKTRTEAPSPEALRIIQRKERKRHTRMLRALAGEHTRVRAVSA